MLFFVSAFGCQHLFLPRVDLDLYQPTSILVMNEDLKAGVPSWVVEANRRYSGPVMVFAHGIDSYGVWYVVPDSGPPIPVDLLVSRIKQEHPRRHVVLVVCNPGRCRLDEPGVSYALDSVWTLPDSALHLRDTLTPAVVGNIFEMRENP